VVAADDSYVVREFLTAALQASPEVELLEVCSDRYEVETALDEHEPEVVITDIRMPPSGGDEGIRLAARLRDTHPKIGVVVLSQ
jgi:DNA-binding NarL/FixJ family response regulator